MPSTPTIFELSSENAATQHNHDESPLLRLPAELRTQIWDLCLSNAHVRIYGHVGHDRRHRTRYLEVHVRRLDEQLGFVVDFSTFRSPVRVKDNYTFVPTNELTRFTHGASYDMTISCPADRSHNDGTFPCRLPALWLVCKLAYNETYDTPAGSIVHFKDWPSFMLLHKYGPNLMGRLKNVSLAISHEKRLKKLLELQSEGSPELISADERILHRKTNLQRMLPALTDLWLGSHINASISYAMGRPLRGREELMGRVQLEQDRVSKMIAFWTPLVQRVHVDEVQDG